MIMLDSSVLIDLFRKKDKTKSRYYHLLNDYDQFSISTVTYYEIGVGSKKEDLVFWHQMLRNFRILPFDLDAARVAIKIRSELRILRKTVDFADLQIASIAISNNIPLSTLNEKHFSVIPDLKIIQN